MYVCICNAITDKQIRKAAKAGVSDLGGLQAELGVATNCGTCSDAAMAVLRESASAAPRRFEPRIFRPAMA